jgi:hypothetical protein
MNIFKPLLSDAQPNRLATDVVLGQKQNVDIPHPQKGRTQTNYANGL